MPKFTGKSGGGPSAMKKYGQGKNPIMMKSPMKKAPHKHLGNATHPTGAIAAHDGHMSKKLTKRDQGYTLNQVINQK